MSEIIVLDTHMTMEGGQNFALIRSVISTARKKGLNILETLTQLLNGENVVFV